MAISFVELGEFVVMPNHMHGIITIDKTHNGWYDGTPSEKWNPDILGVIINQYKPICTIQARKINPGFAWQTRFHDHIIPNDHEYYSISGYINNNPANWVKPN